MRILGREPAVILGILAALLEMLVAYGVHLSSGQTAAINAVAAAAVGLATAAVVARDRLLPAILGAGQAGFGLLLAFGVHLSAHQVGTAMAVIAAVAAAFVRTQVTARITADGSRVPRSGLI